MDRQLALQEIMESQQEMKELPGICPCKRGLLAAVWLHIMTLGLIMSESAAAEDTRKRATAGESSTTPGQ